MGTRAAGLLLRSFLDLSAVAGRGVLPDCMSSLPVRCRALAQRVAIEA